MAGAGVGGTVTGLVLHVVDGGIDIAYTTVRALDWTLEEGATETAPVVAGDLTCTVATADAMPDLFDYSTRRPATLIDTVDVQMVTATLTRVGGYKLSDCLVTSFRAHDGGGISGLEAGLTTLTFDWRKAEVSWGSTTRTYTKPKGG